MLSYLKNTFEVVMLVCRRWGQVLNHARSLWGWASLRVDTRNLAMLPKMLHSGRLRYHASLTVSELTIITFKFCALFVMDYLN